MPVFSLPSEQGIGTLGTAAYQFVDFLESAGQKYWQVLPCVPVDYTNSPYQSLSAFAGNPFFIDYAFLCRDGFLCESDYKGLDFGTDTGSVDYVKVRRHNKAVLLKAYEKFKSRARPLEFDEFLNENGFWVKDYALLSALKEKLGGVSWNEFPISLRDRDPDALAKASGTLSGEIDYYLFEQYIFYKQWNKLKEYANSRGVMIIGDMPIYAPLDSADVWANREIFSLTPDGTPVEVAACPPDAFSADGQLWGCPVYDFEGMKNSDTPYRWWRRRVAHSLRIYDSVRIDHFRAFEAFYAVPFGRTTARDGRWIKGPGMEFFELLKQDLGKTLPIIAEDLGTLTPEVEKLLRDTGFPGMKVLQFAFDGNNNNPYLPHNFPNNCVAYIGTHDNDTVVGWSKNSDSQILRRVGKYLPLSAEQSFNWSMIRLLMMSPADTVILTLPDIMGLSSEGRINTPGTVSGNWKWRISQGCTNPWLAGILRDITETYGRAAK